MKPTALTEPYSSPCWPYLDVLLVVVLDGRPAVVLVVETCLTGEPAVVIETGRRRDLVIGDPPRLHTEGV